MTNTYIPDGFDREDGCIELPSGFTLQLNNDLKGELFAEDTFHSIEVTLETKEIFDIFYGAFK